MSSTIKSILRSLLGLSVAAVFMVLAFRGTDFGELWESLQRVNYFWISLLIPITILSHWIRAVRWSYLLAPIKKDVSYRNLFSAVMIGYLVNNALTRVGEFVRPFVLGKREGISKSSAFGTVVIERIIDFLTFYFIVSVVLFVYPSSLSPFVENVNVVRPLLLVSSLVCCILLAVLFFKISSLVRFASKIRIVVPDRYHHKFDRVVNSFVSGFAVSQMKETFTSIVVLSILMQGLYALGLYIPFFAFDSIASLNLDFGASVVLLTISSIAFVLPAPGGLGTYHSFLTFALIKLYAVDNTTALSYAIVTHEVGYVLVTAIGLYYFLRDHVRFSDVRTEMSEGEDTIA
jgi:uncharacterized protein (TIRG00374 family)